MRKDIQFRSFTMIKIPSYLKPGDSVAIVATARKIDHKSVNQAKIVLESQGYIVSLGEHLFDSLNQFAGHEEARAADFQAALDDDQIKAILCARGGYGTIKMIDLLDWSAFQSRPKWIVGYSDPTVLHNFLSNQGVASIHGTMPINYTSNTESALKSLFNALAGVPKENVKITCHVLNRAGSAEGQLVGGNLSMIYSTMGTPYQLKTKDKILFLEDLDEYLYHIDRMMMNLRLSGALKELRGLVIGGMTDMNDNAIPYGLNAEEIIKSTVEDYNYPVMFGFPAGHIDDNRALKLGCNYALIVDEDHAYFSCNE